ncbi:hypothetical protein H6A03_00985 [[Clostridium] spiroforme]|nr:hypothetical protein [Thomasclavelia spiroformis]
MSISFIGLICGVIVLIACIIYFIIDIKQNRDKIMNIPVYFIVRFVLSCLIAFGVAYLISI